MTLLDTKIKTLLYKACITPYAGERRNAYSLAKRLIFKNNLQYNYPLKINKAFDAYVYLFYKIVCPVYNCKIQVSRDNIYTIIGYKKQLDILLNFEHIYTKLKNENLLYLTQLSSHYIHENLMCWTAGFAVGITHGKSRVNNSDMPFTPMSSDNYCRGVSDGWHIKNK